MKNMFSTQRTEQVEWMNEKYVQYSEDFVLDNINMQDYTRKVIKASLNADLAEDRMRRGQGTPDEYMKAQKIFDDLSKSSNFAACRRKPGESTGMGSLGEIILKLETQGLDFLQRYRPRSARAVRKITY